MLNIPHWDSHRQRLITGFLIAAPLLAVIVAGPWWSWTLLVALASCAGLLEFQRFVFADTLPLRWRACFLAAGLVHPLGAALGGQIGLHFALFLSLFGGFLLVLFCSPLEARESSRLARFSLGCLYIPYLLSYVLLIGQLEQGRALLLFVIVVTVVDDIAAFYCGGRLGTHKLYELVSPKKTIEGSAGGLFFGVLAGTLFGVLFIHGISPWVFVLFSVLLAVTGQLGDLVESMLKRVGGIKDSSNLLPGHGGIMDRLDSMLFAFPMAWFVLALIR